MAYITREEQLNRYRDTIKEVVSRTRMRLPDNTDLLHLGRLLYEVWQSGYDEGRKDGSYSGPEDVTDGVNPYTPPSF